MAYLVGTLLIVLVCVGVPLKYLAADASDAQDAGEWITRYLGVTHGWLYMIFLVTALLLARRAGWSIGFSVVTLLLGTVPFLSFYAERRATAHTRSIMGSASTPSPSPSQNPTA
jgi:integral membrane protein